MLFIPKGIEKRQKNAVFIFLNVMRNERTNENRGSGDSGCG